MTDAIDRRRALPPGAAFERWAVAAGCTIRVACWRDGERGTLLFANGRADFVEKYAEALWWWRARGWAVATFDWRGQGGSGRLGRTPLHGHVDDFASWLADLEMVVARAGELPRPLVAVGHSMGGQLLLAALAGGERRIARAGLLSPMLGIAGPLAPGTAGRVARTMVAAGMGQAFAPGQGGSRDPNAEARRAAALTSDPDRRTDEAWWLARHPELALGGVTWGWLAAAYASMAALERPGAVERIDTPVLAVLAAAERVTDNAAALRIVARLPRGDHVIVEGRHELLREGDAAREAALGRLDAFLEQA